MDLIKGLTWQAVALLAAFLGAIVALVAVGHQSLQDISVFLGASLTAVVLFRQTIQAKTSERIEGNTNGTNEALRQSLTDKDAQLLDLQREHSRVVAQLTAQLPQGAPLPSALADDARV